MKYGYARVSTDGQSVDAQARQLAKAGCKKVFREVASGAKTDRAQLRRLLDQLEAGDVLMVTRLDRLARSTRDLLNTLAAITDRKAGFRSLTDTWADTTTSHGRLMLTVLGGLAEFEPDLIRARTGEGRASGLAVARALDGQSFDQQLEFVAFGGRQLDQPTDHGFRQDDVVALVGIANLQAEPPRRHIIGDPLIQPGRQVQRRHQAGADPVYR